LTENPKEKGFIYQKLAKFTYSGSAYQKNADSGSAYHKTADLKHEYDAYYICPTYFNLKITKI